MIYQIFDTNYSSNTFNNPDLDKKQIKIAVENLGWLSWDGLLYFTGPLDVENLGEYTEPEYDEDEEEDDET